MSVLKFLGSTALPDVVNAVGWLVSFFSTHTRG